MTELNPSDAGKGPPPRKTVSPARNAIGWIALIAVLIVGGIQFSSLAAFRSIVNNLNQRMEDDNKELMTQSEAETIIGRPADEGGSEVSEAGRTYAVKTYTWKGLLKSYTLAAYYSKEQSPHLYRIEPDGVKLESEPPLPPVQHELARQTAGGKPQKSEGKSKKKAEPAAPTKETPRADATPKPVDKPKAEAPKPAADEKPGAGADTKGDAPPKPN